jgi:hypothetical protein
VLGPLPSAFCRALDKPLPSVALGTVSLSVTNVFAESKTLGKKKKLHSAKAALGKRPSAAIYNGWSLAFAERKALTLGKEASLPSVIRLTLGTEVFVECHP